ncbi:MAG: porin family protein [Flavobacterium sp.]|nr:porin family protein [Flavobacterium sp.]
MLLLLAITASSKVKAQKEINRPFHDDLRYYFGITLGYNSTFLHPTKSSRFLQDDSILVAQPGASGGITLGLLATARLSDRFQLRINPQLIIGGAKYFSYTLGSRLPLEAEEQKKILPSTLVSLPVHFKFNSDRLDNFRVYLLGGVRFDKDLSSNSTARNADDLIKLKGSDFALEAGIGCNLFLKFVTISPEIKFTYGLSNIHARDETLKYSSVFDKIQSRMISFSIHFED